MSDIIFVKIMLPTNGLESTQTKKFKKTATVQEVIDTVKLSLHPCLQSCAFMLKKKIGGKLPPDMTIEEIGLPQEFGVYTGLYMLPVDYKEVKRLLDQNTASTERKPVTSGMFAVDQQVIKSGYLLVKHGQKRASYKRRWCVLRESTLLLFATPKDSEAIHVLDLAHGHVHFTFTFRNQHIPSCSPAPRPPSPSVGTKSSPVLVPAIPSAPASGTPTGGRTGRSNSQNEYTGIPVRSGKTPSPGASPGSPPPPPQIGGLYPTAGVTGGSASTVFSLDGINAKKFGATEIPFMDFSQSDGETFNLSAESFDEAQSWITAITSGKSDCSRRPLSIAQQQVLNSSVSSYTIRKTRSSGSARKFAVLVKTQLLFFETPVDTEPPETVDLFAQRIVYDTEKNEIEISSLGDEVITMTFSNEQEFSGWLAKLREALPDFVTEREPETVDLRVGVIKQGWMLVKNTSKRFSTQKKRWCALKDKKLFFLHGPKEGKVLGMVDLMHTQASFFETEAFNGRSNDQRIDIITAGASYCLRLAEANPDPTKHELKEWCDVIQSNCVGKAFNVVHKQHVDFDFNWTVGDPRELFEFHKKIGAGAFASVYYAKQKETGFEVAIKILRIKASTAQSLKQEIDVLKTCHSPQIMSYFGTCQLPNQLWILTEFCKCGSLKDLMKTTFETLNEAQLSFACMETLRGLLYLHGKGILHLDVKAGNLLLTEEGAVKLADFGVSQQLQGTDKVVAENYVGSPLYMSPEVLRKSVYGAKTDVWSLGITVIELAEGQPPNMGVTSFDVLLKRHLHAPPRLTTPAGWSAKLNDFISKCLVLDAEERASPIDLLVHPFLNPHQDQSCMLPLVHLCLSMRKDSGSKGIIVPEEFRDSQSGASLEAPNSMQPVALQEGQKNPLLSGNVPRLTPLQMALNSQIVSLRKTDDPDAHLIRPQDSIGPSSPRSPSFLSSSPPSSSNQPSPLRLDEKFESPSSSPSIPSKASDDVKPPPSLPSPTTGEIKPPSSLPFEAAIPPMGSPVTVSAPLTLPEAATGAFYVPPPIQDQPETSSGVPVPQKPIQRGLGLASEVAEESSDVVGTPFESSLSSMDNISPDFSPVSSGSLDDYNPPAVTAERRVAVPINIQPGVRKTHLQIRPPPSISQQTGASQTQYNTQTPMSPLSFATVPVDDYGG